MSQFSYLLPQAESQVRSQLGTGFAGQHVHHHHHYHGGDLIGDIKHTFSPANMRKVAKKVVHYAVPSVAAALGGAAGAFVGGPAGAVIGSTVAGATGKYGADKTEESMGGSIRRNRKSKTVDMEGVGLLSGLLDK